MNPTPSIGRILAAPSGGLQPLCDHAAWLSRLSLNLRRDLEPPLSHHVYVTNIRQSCAILATDSPAWLSRLRFQTDRLLTLLRRYPDLNHLDSVRIIIIPPRGLPVRRRRQPARMSAEAARALRQMASAIEQPGIRDALLRLARHGASSVP